MAGLYTLGKMYLSQLCWCMFGIDVQFTLIRFDLCTYCNANHRHEGSLGCNVPDLARCKWDRFHTLYSVFRTMFKITSLQSSTPCLKRHSCCWSLNVEVNQHLYHLKFRFAQNPNDHHSQNSTYFTFASSIHVLYISLLELLSIAKISKHFYIIFCIYFFRNFNQEKSW